VRNDLKAVEGVSNIKTDLDEMTCDFEIDKSVDVSELLDGLASKNSKMLEWSFSADVVAGE